MSVRTFLDRPIVDGVEQRFRFELRNVDERERRYKYINDLRTYCEAVLYLDVARHMMPDVHFIVWDNVERKILADSRELQKKTAPVDCRGRACALCGDVAGATRAE